MAGTKAAMTRTAIVAKEREADADADCEEIKADLELGPSKVVYLADWLLEAKLAYRLASEAALARTRRTCEHRGRRANCFLARGVPVARQLTAMRNQSFMEVSAKWIPLE